MSTIIRSIIAIFIGLFVGGIINMGLVTLGPQVFPLPEGSDITTMEGLQESMSIMKPVNFIFPYLAHALGTLVGAYTAARIGLTKQMSLALLIGVIFLVGGATMVYKVGGPTWFCTLDLLSYLPMAFIGGKMAVRASNKF